MQLKVVAHDKIDFKENTIMKIIKNSLSFKKLINVYYIITIIVIIKNLNYLLFL